MFSIKPTTDNLPYHEGPMARITIGEFSESITCTPSSGSIEEMHKQWLIDLDKLLVGKSAITIQYDPRLAWIIYREGNNLYAQEAMALIRSKM